MRRRSSALLLAALVTLVGIARASPARAATDARGPLAGALVAVPAAGSPATPSGDGFAFGLDPGATTKPQLAVSNHSTDQRFTVQIAPVDATVAGDRIEYADRATSGGTGSWVTATVGQVVVDPGATLNVPFTLAVPDDAPTGSHSVAGLLVSVTRAQSTTGGASPASGLPSVQVPVIVNVAGAATPQLSIDSVVATHDERHASFLAIKLHNSGAVEAHAVGTVTAPGGETRRNVDVTVDPGADRTVLVPWDDIDAVRGANVDVELDYGTDDTASWVGNVAAEDVGKAPAKHAGDGTSGGVSSAAGAAKKPFPWGMVAVIALVALLVLGALGFFLRELLRTRAPVPLPASGPIAVDVASLPALQLTVDPSHTEVLNALVTQVGALGGAIEKLADRVGVPVAIPPGPPLLTPQPQRRRHGRRANHPASDEPVVTTSALAAPRVDAPMPAPAAAATAREFDDITAALQEIPAPPPPVAPVAPAPAPVAPVAPAPAPVHVPPDFEAPPFFAPPILPPAHPEPEPEPGPAPEPDTPDELAELRSQRGVPAFIPPPRVTDDDWLSDEAIDVMLAQRDTPSTDADD